MNETYVLGVDPSKWKLTACLVRQRRGPAVMAPRDFGAQREGFEELLAQLREHLGAGDRLVVGVEASGALDDNFLAWLAGLDGKQPWAIQVIRLDPLRWRATAARVPCGARPTRPTLGAGVPPVSHGQDAHAT